LVLFKFTKLNLRLILFCPNVDNPAELITDSEIIKKISGGDKDQYRFLVERYQQVIFRLCLGFVHNRDDADDLVQEVFIQAYQAIPGFRAESSFSTWLYRIAVNASLNHVRRKSKNFFLRRIDDYFGSEKIYTGELNVIDDSDPESLLIRDEQRTWVKKTLDSLPDNQRTAIVLSKYDDLSQKEIASILDISEGAVEALLQRAKANLRKRLATENKKSIKP
jgi:RNA polymerase sigma-70 factor (ECF subfamily)